MTVNPERGGYGRDAAPSISSSPPSLPSGTEASVLGVLRWASPGWLLFLGLALAEIVALFVRLERVTPESDWKSAAELVRSRFESHDAITVAPSWADPVLRMYLGDRITAKMAGRSGLSAYERLWVLSIRGARSAEAPMRAPDFSETRGRVTVERYDFGPSPVVFDFVDALPSAQVSFSKGGVPTDCPWKERAGGSARGGLGFGPVAPRERFVCDQKRPWLWVGTTIIEDLSLSPRRCVFQHPEGKDPVSVTYRNVHLGRRLVIYAGLDYHHERDETRAPVTMRVLASGREIGRLVHRDGEGMKRVEFDTTQATSESLPPRADLTFEVTAPNPHRRAFCWAGSIEDARRREAP